MDENVSVLPRLCIASGADRVRYRSHVNQAVFAQENGYDYRFDLGVNEGGLRSHFDIKLRVLQRLLPLYEWVMWVDDDVWFTDFRPGLVDAVIDEAEADGKDIVIARGAREPRGFSSFLNSGVILLRRSEAAGRLLEEVLDEPIEAVAAWWDEEKYGIFTHGDQDQIVKVLVDSDLLTSTWLIDPQRLNSRTHLYSASAQDAAICHFCGHYDRELSLAQFAERFGLSPDLLPLDVARRYGLPTMLMPARERALRERRRALRGRLKPYAKPVRDTLRQLRSRRCDA